MKTRTLIIVIGLLISLLICCVSCYMLFKDIIIVKHIRGTCLIFTPEYDCYDYNTQTKIHISWLFIFMLGVYLMFIASIPINNKNLDLFWIYFGLALMPIGVFLPRLLYESNKADPHLIILSITIILFALYARLCRFFKDNRYSNSGFVP